MELFYKATNVNGGGKLYFNDTEVKKLYFGDELVYEYKKPMLPTGTILWNQNILSNGLGSSKIITLDKVTNDFANVDLKLIISAGFKSSGTFSTECSVDELFDGVSISTNYQSEVVSVKALPDSNKIKITFASSSSEFRGIEVR